LLINILIATQTGLGSSASHHLVEGMARAGNGTALFASLEERLEKKVMQQLQDALQPALTGRQSFSKNMQLIIQITLEVITNRYQDQLGRL
jgi:hypothetical protein